MPGRNFLKKKPQRRCVVFRGQASGLNGAILVCYLSLLLSIEEYTADNLKIHRIVSTAANGRVKLSRKPTRQDISDK